MFVGFNLKHRRISFDKNNECYSSGMRTQELCKRLIYIKMIEYIKGNKVLNAESIMNYCFPKKKYHIFLSHSHNDLELAQMIADVLKAKHNLDVFIDSNIWLNYIDILNLVVKEYYLNNNDKILQAASHIQMMLMDSLNYMIDKTECLFFLNTPNSVPLKDNINSYTYSTWIFSEIEIAKIIRRIQPKRHNNFTKYFSESLGYRELKIVYKLGLENLISLSEDDFIKWINEKENTPEDALDSLYLKKKIIELR
ncbi:hypothetical protein SAMN05444369_1123 [Capnocytophaga haemolytica]|jgi:hypothetical protein|uniref:TIR domain-containing protein n=2 Tax=Capnocytophaga haemolytica TaxID=45243 RepID=A0AAX2GU31_9FLAO|nr:hypothetical protein [Capnocytophaga haemolytica]SFO17809.1 hypothetical protein SAMN05444369_1123 [Capnocytophaga haemolytica]SNV01058.1 Uncharacterised protein [Capnocytophaga haemolytica]